MGARCDRLGEFREKFISAGSCEILAAICIPLFLQSISFSALGDASPKAQSIREVPWGPVWFCDSGLPLDLSRVCEVHVAQMMEQFGTFLLCDIEGMFVATASEKFPGCLSKVIEVIHRSKVRKISSCSDLFGLALEPAMTGRPDGRCRLLRAAVLRSSARWLPHNVGRTPYLNSSFTQKIATDCSGLDTPAFAAEACEIPFEQPYLVLDFAVLGIGHMAFFGV